jgi:Ribbon-helix-helix domain
MSATNLNQTRWTVSVSKDTDTALRVFLAQRGLKKGDMSKFIEESVRWRVFDQSMSEAQSKFSDISPTDLQALIDEASISIKNEMRQEIVGNIG